MILDRWPDKTPITESLVTPVWQRWFTMLVTIVNGLTDSIATIISDIADLQPLAGSWTPIDVSGAGLTFTTAEGSFYRTGRLVYVAGHVVYPVTADTSSAVIAGLPFPELAGQYAAVSMAFTNATLDLIGGVIPSTTTLFWSLNTGAAVTNAQLSGKNIRFSAVYQTIP